MEERTRIKTGNFSLVVEVGAFACIPIDFVKINYLKVNGETWLEDDYTILPAPSTCDPDVLAMMVDMGINIDTFPFKKIRFNREITGDIEYSYQYIQVGGFWWHKPDSDSYFQPNYDDTSTE